jgi:hypothetical protein
MMFSKTEWSDMTVQVSAKMAAKKETLVGECPAVTGARTHRCGKQ